jgi:hypothetical protein
MKKQLASLLRQVPDQLSSMKDRFMKKAPEAPSAMQAAASAPKTAAAAPNNLRAATSAPTEPTFNKATNKWETPKSPPAFDKEPVNNRVGKESPTGQQVQGDPSKYKPARPVDMGGPSSGAPYSLRDKFNDVLNIGKRTVADSGRIIKGATRLAPYAGVGAAAYEAGQIMNDPNKTGIDKASAVAESVGTGATAYLGAKLGAAGGAFLGPAGAAVGGLAGGAAGYFGGEALINKLRGDQPAGDKPAQESLRGKGFDDPRDITKDPSRMSLGASRDFTKELASVPKTLPTDLREGVVYKTIGESGNPVYSGKNVKENAQFVDGSGRNTLRGGGFAVVPAGSGFGSVGDGPSWVREQANFERLKAMSPEDRKYAMASQAERDTMNQANMQANQEYNGMINTRERMRDVESIFKKAKTIRGKQAAINMMVALETAEVAREQNRGTLRSQTIAEEKLAQASLRAEQKEDRLNRNEEFKTMTEANRVKAEQASAARAERGANFDRRMKELETKFNGDKVKASEYMTFMDNYRVSKANAAKAQGNMQAYEQLISEDYVMDATDRAELDTLWNIRAKTKEKDGWLPGEGHYKESLNPEDFRIRNINTNMRPIGAGKGELAGGGSVYINDLTDDGWLSPAMDGRFDPMIAEARRRVAEKTAALRGN